MISIIFIKTTASNKINPVENIDLYTHITCSDTAFKFHTQCIINLTLNKFRLQSFSNKIQN